MAEKHPYTILLTGSTGFLGQYILRDLLLRGPRVVAMLRGPLAESTRRLGGLLEDIGLDAGPYLEQGKLVLVEGSLPDKLPAADWGRTDTVINCAACLQLLSNGNGEPYSTNVDGTRAILDWVGHNNVSCMHAVSTAYTCGWNSGVIREEFHRPRPEFQTDYERSKWQAEELLDEWASKTGQSLTVFRPSLLVGDSETGHTSQYGGFYQFARLVSVLKQQYREGDNGEKTHIPLRIPGKPDDPQNLVSVDFVSRLIAEVVMNPVYHGRIYHLSNPEPPTNDMMKRCCEEYFGLQGGYFADPDEVVGHCSTAESLLWDQYNVLTPRIVHTPRFDVTHTRRVMEAEGISFPTLTTERIFRLFDYATDRDWGKQ